MLPYVRNPLSFPILLFSGLVATDLLVGIVHLAPAWPLQALLFVLLSFVPGAAILRMIRTPFASLLTNTVSSFGLSILALMLSGLAANQLLPLFGVDRPLSTLGILGFLNAITIICIVIGSATNHAKPRLSTDLRWCISKRAVAMILASAVLPILAAFGAFRLNNGGDAVIACLALGYAACLIVSTFCQRERLSEGVITWIIFVLGLSILLMTALRGWDITGHDIMREFRVYTMTHLSGTWNIEAYRDAYNACLSITILPEAYVQLMHVSGLFVFKVLMQILFAVCPVVVYLLLRQHLGRLGALVGVVFFISYSTFINDAAMLTRQGVAYLFFSLALLTAMDKMTKRLTTSHKLLFLGCSLGIILSHYSTTYMFVALFVVAVSCKVVVKQLFRSKMHDDQLKRTVLTPFFALIIILSAFMWYAQITQTSNGLATTIKTSIHNIPNLLSDDNKSADTASALLFASKKTQVDVYESYLNDTNQENLKATERYLPSLTDDIIPPTGLGRQLHDWGIESSLITELRQHTARFLQVLAFCSVLYAAYLLLRKRPRALSLDFVCVATGVIALLTIMVVLPTFSLNYGMLRAFHQAMIVLLVPMMILLAWCGQRLWPRLRVGVAVSSMTGLFLLFTGLFAQMVGGVSAPLTLNNRGLYYGLYYTTAADLRAFTWLKAYVHDKQAVRATGYAQAVMHDPDYPFNGIGILPSQIHPGNYVYLSRAQVVEQKFYVHYDGSPLITTFPLNYYIEQTNKLYSTATTGVFRQ